MWDQFLQLSIFVQTFEVLFVIVGDVHLFTNIG